MPKNKMPSFYTTMIEKLDNLDDKVNEIQRSIKIFKAMISERIDTETVNPDDQIESKND